MSFRICFWKIRPIATMTASVIKMWIRLSFNICTNSLSSFYCLCWLVFVDVIEQGGFVFFSDIIIGVVEILVVPFLAVFAKEVKFAGDDIGFGVAFGGEGFVHCEDELVITRSP